MHILMIEDTEAVCEMMEMFFENEGWKASFYHDGKEGLDAFLSLIHIQMCIRDIASGVSKLTKILFPIIITIVAGFIAPISLPLVGFLMFGNLLRECGVLDNLSQAAQNELVNIVSILLGITISVKMQADLFLNVQTLMIILFGLVAFIMDSIGGVVFAKILNLFRREKINPMIGAAGISAFPMSSRVIQKMATDEDPQNFILMYAVGANVSGQIASVIAGGLLLSFFM